MVRVQGVVAAEVGVLVFADATLTVGKKKRVERREGPGRFTLRLADGRTLEVRGVREAERAGEIDLSGPYGEFVSHPIARLFDAHAPGDHVRARIRGFGLFGADPVTVIGEVLEERATAEGADGGLRDAPRREPAVIGAERIVLGHGADEAPPRAVAPRHDARVRHPLETSSRAYLALGLAWLVPGLVLSWLAPLVPERAWLTPVVGLGLASSLLGWHRLARGRWHASYVSVVGGACLTPEPLVGYRVDPWLVVFGYASWAWLCAIDPSPSAVTVFLAACAVLPALHLALVAYQEAPFRRFASLVLGLPAFDPSSGSAAEGRMSLAEARVISRGTAVRRRVEFVPTTETAYSTDASGQSHESSSTVLRDREQTRAETFRLEGAGAAPIEVRCRGALVAFARRVWRPHASLAVYEETLSEGETACVAARFAQSEGEITAAAQGEESLFVFGGTRAGLARALRHARLRLVLGAGLALLPIALALYAFPFGARFHAVGTVTASSGVVPMGETCDVRVLAYHAGLAPRCSLRLACGGVELYGGFGLGQMECTFEASALEPALSASDASAFDGDPAVALSLRDGTLSWTDDQGASLFARLEPATPSAWW
jgi:hypothetical protein